MKHLKRFNEKLKPETYINAGQRLKNLPGGGKRSTPLIDYGLKKQYGFYRMHLATNSGISAKDATFTNPKCECYFSIPSLDVRTFNYSAEEAIEFWAEGDKPLCITFNFTFQPTEETKDKYSNVSELKTVALPMFAFEVWFSHWEEGLDSYNWDFDNEAPFPPSDAADINTMYKNTNLVAVYKRNPVRKYYNRQYPYYGIFSDRKSALKFKRQLNNLIEPHKEKVMELLSCVNASADDIDEFETKINNISVNNLFSIDFDRDTQSKWFIRIS